MLGVLDKHRIEIWQIVSTFVLGRLCSAVCLPINFSEKTGTTARISHEALISDFAQLRCHILNRAGIVLIVIRANGRSFSVVSDLYESLQIGVVRQGIIRSSFVWKLLGCEGEM